MFAQGGYQWALLLMACSLALMFEGAGQASLDRKLDILNCRRRAMRANRKESSVIESVVISGSQSAHPSVTFARMAALLQFRTGGRIGLVRVRAGIPCATGLRRIR